MEKRSSGKGAGRLLSMGLAFALLAAGCSGEKKTGESAPGPPAEGNPPAARTQAPAPETAAVKRLTGDPENGRRIYEQYCHFCHGRGGFGDGPVGIAITPHPADFVNDTKRMAKTDEELFISITKGVHREIGGEEMAMPRWQDILSDQERWDVLSYIRKLSQEGKKKQ